MSKPKWSRVTRWSMSLKAVALIAGFGLLVPFGSNDAGAHGDNTDPNYLHLCVYSVTGQIAFRSPNSNPACNYANRTVIHMPTSAVIGPSGPAGDDGPTVLMGRTVTNVAAAGNTWYLPVGSSGPHSAVEANAATRLTISGTITALQMYTNIVPSAGNQFSFQLMINGSASGPICQIQNTANSCFVAPNLPVDIGDAVSVRFTSSPGATLGAPRFGLVVS